MPKRIEHVISERIAALRVGEGMTQADMANAMCRIGFAWKANRVTQIETGRRPVSLTELAGVASVLGVGVAALIPDGLSVALPNGAAPSSDFRRALIDGASLPPTRKSVAPANDDLRKVAASIGATPEKLDAMCSDTYGRTFREERDHRSGAPWSDRSRSAQTKRGHASRKILAELRG